MASSLWVDRALLFLNCVLPLLEACVLLAFLYLPVSPPLLCSSSRTTPSGATEDAVSTHFVSSLCYNQLLTKWNSLDRAVPPDSLVLFLLIVSGLFYLAYQFWQHAVGTTLQRAIGLMRHELLHLQQAFQEARREGCVFPALDVWTFIPVLSRWQNSHFLWRRYLCLHLVWMLHLTTVTTCLLVVLFLHDGSPFITSFECQMTSSSSVPCVLRLAPLLNCTVKLLLGISCCSLLVQMVHLYATFGTGVCLRASEAYLDSSAVGLYVRLLIHAQFRSQLPQQRRSPIQAIHVTLRKSLFRSDFHFLTQLLPREGPVMATLVSALNGLEEEMQRICSEPASYATSSERSHLLLSNGMHGVVSPGSASNPLMRANLIHHGPTPGIVNSRTKWKGGLSRTENMSERWNFSHMQIRVELDDLFM